MGMKGYFGRAGRNTRAKVEITVRLMVTFADHFQSFECSLNYNNAHFSDRFSLSTWHMRLTSMTSPFTALSAKTILSSVRRLMRFRIEDFVQLIHLGIDLEEQL
jgi:hypothetical protein